MKFILDLNSKKMSFNVSKIDFLKYYSGIEMSYVKDELTIFEMEEFILELPFKSCISFSFLEESLIGVCIGPAMEYLTYPKYDVLQTYKLYNNALSKFYGAPNKSTKIFETKSIWKFDDAIMEHYLIDRFDIQEVLTIKLK